MTVKLLSEEELQPLANAFEFDLEFQGDIDRALRLVAIARWAAKAHAFLVEIHADYGSKPDSRLSQLLAQIAPPEVPERA